MSAQDCIAGGQNGSPTQHLPDWVPAGVHLYLSHTAHGRSLRALARDHGCHASTIMRQVRRFENRRDDPLVDDALRNLDRALRASAQSLSQSESAKMMSRMATRPDTQIVPSIEHEGLRCLVHLVQGEALLIVAPDMAKAVVTREDADGVSRRVAVVDRAVAEAMALRD